MFRSPIFSKNSSGESLQAVPVRLNRETGVLSMRQVVLMKILNSCFARLPELWSCGKFAGI